MKIDIETYKDQLIQYDLDADKFVCDISIEDKYKSTKRQSLKDVRKEIDQFIKLNLEFKPFKIIKRSSWDNDFTVVTIKSLRTDGRFMQDTGSSYNPLIGAKEALECYVYDPLLVSRQKEIKDELELAHEKAIKELKELVGLLVPADFSKYDLK